MTSPVSLPSTRGTATGGPIRTRTGCRWIFFAPTGIVRWLPTMAIGRTGTPTFSAQ